MRTFMLMAALLALGCKETPEDRAKRKAEAQQEYDKLGERAKAAEQRARDKALAEEQARGGGRHVGGQPTPPSGPVPSAPAASPYASMTPTQREQALRAACDAADGCSRAIRSAVIAGAASETERAKLGALGLKLGDAYDVAQRDAYVGEVARDFIAHNRKGFVVNADQTGGKRFVIKAPFCSEEYLRGFAGGLWGSEARDRGFTQMECQNDGLSWRRDL